jgi:hypothetical protein
MQTRFAPSAIGAFESDADEARVKDVPPDITSPAYWSGACACATAWLAFVLYAVSQGMD